MKIYHNIKEFPRVKNPIVTTGTFDGVHIGHQKLINRLNQLAKDVDGETVLFTFDPHPRMVLHPEDHGLQLLSTLDEKCEQLEAAGIDHLVVQPFSKKFSRMTALEYVRDFLVNQLHVHTIVIGYNHHFGRNREGSFQQLKEFSEMFDFKVEEIGPQEIEQINVSSTKTRNALLNGEVDRAAKYLGNNYQLNGRVIKGKMLGRQLGFPTANLDLTSPHKLIPKPGAYAVMVEVDKIWHKGMLNIGINPTAGSDNQTTIEVHVLDFAQDIYDKRIKVAFVKRIRDEVKFDSLDALKSQLEQDKQHVISL